MVLIVKLFYSTFAKDGSDSLCVVSNISLVGPILQTFSFPSLLCLKGGDSFVTHGKVDEADSKLVILTFLHPTVFYSSSAIGSATLTGKGPPRFSRLVFTRIFCEYYMFQSYKYIMRRRAEMCMIASKGNCPGLMVLRSSLFSVVNFHVSNQHCWPVGLEVYIRVFHM